MIHNNLDLKGIRSYRGKTLPIYTRYVLDPISRLVVLYVLKKNFNLKPYFYTYLGLLLALTSGYFFLNKYYFFGAIVFQISIVFDMVDGYIARIKSSGSCFGIISDGFADFLRVFLNLFALYMSLDTKTNVINFLTVYFIYVVFENSINLSLKECENYFKNKSLKQNPLDKKIIILKKKLEKKNLRLIFFYYHERYLLIFFIGPIIGLEELMVYIAILLSLIFLILKIILDLALIKN